MGLMLRSGAINRNFEGGGFSTRGFRLVKSDPEPAEIHHPEIDLLENAQSLSVENLGVGLPRWMTST